MARQVIISQNAARDMRSVREWLKQPGAGPKATRRLAQIRSAIRTLRHSPMQWPAGAHAAAREFTVAGYRVIYAVKPDTGENATAGDVEVLRVFGPYQDRSRL
ncbi:MAG: type II toxin-antitoxin system RelE/ParE family toxin [Microvirga sp.]